MLNISCRSWRTLIWNTETYIKHHWHCPKAALEGSQTLWKGRWEEETPRSLGTEGKAQCTSLPTHSVRTVELLGETPAERGGHCSTHRHTVLPELTGKCPGAQNKKASWVLQYNLSLTNEKPHAQLIKSEFISGNLTDASLSWRFDIWFRGYGS